MDKINYIKLAIVEAKKSIPEDDRPHPFVGAVAVKDDNVLASTHRGEIKPGDHAEFTLMEKKLGKQSLAGAAIYTTLEPCTTRKHPKIPCVERLIEQRIRKVVIGQLDPNPLVRGKGLLRLRDANVEVELFPSKLTAELEELNRGFTRSFKRQRGRPGGPEQAATIVRRSLERKILKQQQEQAAPVVSDQAHEVLNWVQSKLSKIDGSYIITHSKDENGKLAALLYSRVVGEIIGTCFFERPDYGDSDFARFISLQSVFKRITTEQVCPPSVRNRILNGFRLLSCTARLVVLPRNLEISKIGGIFCRMPDKSHLAFITLNNRGGLQQDEGVVMCGDIAAELFRYFSSFEGKD